MKFEVGDICKLRNGYFVIVENINHNRIWGIHCHNIKDPYLKYLFNTEGQYDLYGENHKYDVVKIFKKEEYPEIYI